MFLQGLKSVVHNVPEIVEVVGTKYVDELLCVHEEDVKKAKEVLQLIFTQLMAASKDVIAQALSRLISRLSIKNEVPVDLYFKFVIKSCRNSSSG